MEKLKNRLSDPHCFFLALAHSISLTHATFSFNSLSFFSSLRPTFSLTLSLTCSAVPYFFCKWALPSLNLTINFRCHLLKGSESTLSSQPETQIFFSMPSTDYLDRVKMWVVNIYRYIDFVPFYLKLTFYCTRIWPTIYAYRNSAYSLFIVLLVSKFRSAQITISNIGIKYLKLVVVAPTLHCYAQSWVMWQRILAYHQMGQSIQEWTK